MICSDLLIYKIFPKQNNISLYDRGTKLCAAITAERCESSCPNLKGLFAFLRIDSPAVFSDVAAEDVVARLAVCAR